MPNEYSPRSDRTMYFIGVTTGKSSIMKVFPKWAEYLKLNAKIEGFDFLHHDAAGKYREAVAFIKRDPLSLGALVTTHKIDLLTACRDMFDSLDPYADILGEVSSISKRGGRLIGHAKDPITSGLSLERIVPDGHWKETGADMLLLGAGGSCLALTMYLKEKKDKGGDVPARIIVDNRSRPRLDEMRRIHEKIGFDIPIEYNLCPTPDLNDKVMAALKPGSMVVNGTGLGKDGPGSPLTDAGVFPENGQVWEFNYRGDLVFLDQARAQEKSRNLHVVDGWDYFVYGWTRVVAEVFDVDIPVTGAGFDAVSDLAASAR
ncbi:MAG: shikimate dehydrogenase [Planctomycetota bacterium]|nr:shikimate dehydrogenase [Planctomycetota bacterium]